MKTIEWNTIDKSGWPPGPWKSKPDKKQWLDEATGYPCLIKRNPLGALCGYVGIPFNHPRYHQDWHDFAAYVHGGITFADHCQEGPQEETICHIPDPNEPDNVWWLGFDCAHAGDKCPAPIGMGMFLRGTYRDLSYVESECRSLAKQLKEMETMETQP